MSALRVRVPRHVLEWAVARSRRGGAAFGRRFPQLDAWLDGSGAPTVRQLQAFARYAHLPYGYLLLPEPVDEAVPIPDYRTLDHDRVAAPSPELLDTIHLAQQRQAWYRDYRQQEQGEPLAFVGSIRVGDDAIVVATRAREALGIDVQQRRGYTWEQAFRRLIDAVEATGILVMKGGVVGNQNRRRLSVEEFRGFALADDLAPLVFVNTQDSLSAQTFTLVHEVLHVWLGQSALTDIGLESPPADADQVRRAERWCNAVAGEVLVPGSDLRRAYDPGHDLAEQLRALRDRYKVSTLVVLHRLQQTRLLPWDAFRAAYQAEEARLAAVAAERQAPSGGDYYRSQPLRVGQRFLDAIIADTLEGRTRYTDAYRLIGVGGERTFHELARRRAGLAA